MSKQLDAQIDAALEGLDFAHRTQARLFDLSAVLDSGHSIPDGVFDASLEAVVGKVDGAGRFDRVTKAVIYIRDLIVRLFQTLYNAVVDLIKTYRRKAERLFQEITNVQNAAIEAGKSGQLRGERVGLIDNLPIAMRLYRAPGVTFNRVTDDLKAIDILINTTTTVINNRKRENNELLAKLAKIDTLKEFIDLIKPTTEGKIPLTQADGTTIAQLHLGPNQSVKVSPPFAGNVSIAYVGYRPNAKLSDYVQTDKPYPPVPWMNSLFGFYLVSTDTKLKLNSKAVTQIPILSAREINAIVPMLKAQIINFKAVINTFDSMASALRTATSAAKRLPIEQLDLTAQNAVRAYISDGTRADFAFSRAMMKHLYSVLFGATLWTRVSLNQYLL